MRRTSVSTPAGALGQRALPVIVLVVAGLHAGLIGVLLTPDANRPLTPPRALTVSLVAPPTETRRDAVKPEPRPTQPEPRPRPEASPAPLPVPERRLQTTGPAAATPTQPAIADAHVEPAPDPSTAPSPRPEPTPPLAAMDPSSTPAAPTATSPHPAGYLNNPKPPYPALSKRLGEAGTVRLNVLINPDGSVARLELAQSSGHPRLDRAAIETVRSQWKFAPARQRGQPVSAWVIVPIEFTLRS
ncbi:MAG: energy transducer TonB [Thiobacillus sp.]|nr:energy transducer TonB [Thiobacillus sp.]